MSKDTRRRRVDLRVVEVSPAPSDEGQGGGGSGGGGSEGGGGSHSARPIVQIAAGWRTQAIDEAEQHLVQLDRELFQRGREIVRVAPQQIDIGQARRVWTLAIVPVGVQHMRERFTRVVDLRRWLEKTKEWRTSDCPKDFADYGGHPWWSLLLALAAGTAITSRRHPHISILILIAIVILYSWAGLS